MQRFFTFAMMVLAVASTAVGQNLLVNPTFTDPPVIQGCEQEFTPVTAWTFVGEDGGSRRNGHYHGPTAGNGCPRDGDNTYASNEGWGYLTKYFYQTVSGLTPGQAYRLTGVWWYGHDLLVSGEVLICSAELRDGASAGGTMIAQTQRFATAAGSTNAWLPFVACGVASSDQITVVLRAQHNGWMGFGMHVDDLRLEAVSSCTAPNEVEGIAPAYGARGQTVSVTITGTGFVSGGTSVKLARADQPDIVATNVQVQNSTTLTCDLNLSGAANGRWNVVVSFPAGSPSNVTLPNGFLVVLPALSNGSFELPSAPGGCPAVPLVGRPTDWIFTALATWDGGPTGFYRDSDQSPPTCPPPDGVHYGSVYSIPPDPNAQPESHVYQTLAVDNTKQYVLTGYLAGQGNHYALLEILDGDETADVGAVAAVHAGGTDPYDWTYAFVPFQPSGNLMTVRWRVSTRNPGPHVSHADNLSLLVCADGISFAGMAPNQADNSGLIHATISGSGFSGGPTPLVLLTQEGGDSVPATNVTVVNDSTLTCDFDLTGQRPGSRGILLVKGGCFAKVADAILIVPAVAPAFVNGEFELPQAPVNCGPPPTRMPGIPQGWYVDLQTGSMDRDVEVHPPTCPCPLSAGGHYATLSAPSTGLMFAYQIVRVIPGSTYTLSGYFAGAGQNNVYIALVDGLDPLAFPLAEEVVRAHSGGPDPNEPYDWTAKSVTATAASDVMAIVWYMEVIGAEVASASHADGLTFGRPCNTPSQDVDGDGDVDLTDFGAFQACFNGPNRPWPGPPIDQAICACLDGDADRDVDLADFGAFQACFNGPNRPPACP